MLQKLYDHPNLAPDVLSFVKNLLVKMTTWNHHQGKSSAYTMNFEPYSPNTIQNVFYQYANEPSSSQSVTVLGGQSGHSYAKSSHSFLKAVTSLQKQYAKHSQQNAKSFYGFSSATPKTDCFLNLHQGTSNPYDCLNSNSLNFVQNGNHNDMGWINRGRKMYDGSYSYGKSSASRSHYSVSYNKHVANSLLTSHPSSSKSQFTGYSLYHEPTIQEQFYQSQSIPETSYELTNCNYGEPQGFEYQYLYGQSTRPQTHTHNIPSTSSFLTSLPMTSNFHSTDYQFYDRPAIQDTFYQSFNSVPDMHYQSSAWNYGKQQTSSYHTKSPQTQYSYSVSYEEPKVTSNYHSSSYLQYDKPTIRDQFYSHLTEYPQLPETYYESIDCNNYGEPHTFKCQYGHSTSPQIQSSYSVSYSEPISLQTSRQIIDSSQSTNCHKSTFHPYQSTQSQLFNTFPDISYESVGCSYGKQHSPKYSYMYDQSSNHQAHSSYSAGYNKAISNSLLTYPDISTNYQSGGYQYYDNPSIQDELYQYTYEYPESFSTVSKMNYGSTYPHISTSSQSGGYQYYDTPAIDEFQQYTYEYPQTFSSASKMNYGASKWSYGKSHTSSYLNNWQIPQQLPSNSQFSLYDTTMTQDVLHPYPQQFPGYQNGISDWMGSNTQFSEFPFQYDIQGSQLKSPSYSELSVFGNANKETRLSLCSLNFKSIYKKIRSIIRENPSWREFLEPMVKTVTNWFNSRPHWFQSSIKSLYGPLTKLFDTQSYGSALLPKQQYSYSDGNITRGYFLKFMRHIVKQLVQCMISKVTQAVGDSGSTGCQAYDTNSFQSMYDQRVLGFSSFIKTSICRFRRSL
jgi:hypothetical protein